MKADAPKRKIFNDAVDLLSTGGAGSYRQRCGDVGYRFNKTVSASSLPPV
ncbi:MAG: hypothetical protein ACLSHX_01260 [Suilimivivens sp.]